MGKGVITKSSSSSTTRLKFNSEQIASKAAFKLCGTYYVCTSNRRTTRRGISYIAHRTGGRWRQNFSRGVHGLEEVLVGLRQDGTTAWLGSRERGGCRGPWEEYVQRWTTFGWWWWWYPTQDRNLKKKSSAGIFFNISILIKLPDLILYAGEATSKI